MMLIGEQGVRLNLMQKWDMNELYKVGLSKQTGSNERFSLFRKIPSPLRWSKWLKLPQNENEIGNI